MKKIFYFIVLFSIFGSFIEKSFAQQKSEDDSANNRSWISDEYKRELPYGITAGLFVYYDAMIPGRNGKTIEAGVETLGVKYPVNHGGGISFNGKINLKRWLAIGLDLSISGSPETDITNIVYTGQPGITGKYTRNMSLFTLSPSIIFQYETKRGESGFVPWAGLGFTLYSNKITEKDTTSGTNIITEDLNNGLGFLFQAGLRYNFKNNIYTGLRLDYILMQHNSSNTYNNPHNPVLNNVKFGIEAGYRF